MNAIFELVDASDPERYYPIGVWLTEEEAVAFLLKCDKPGDFSDEEHDGYAKAQIRRREIGRSGLCLSGRGLSNWPKPGQRGNGLGFGCQGSGSEKELAENKDL